MPSITISDISGVLGFVESLLPRRMSEVLKDCGVVESDDETAGTLVRLSPHLDKTLHNFMCWAASDEDFDMADLSNMDFEQVNPFEVLTGVYWLLSHRPQPA